MLGAKQIWLSRRRKIMTTEQYVAWQPIASLEHGRVKNESAVRSIGPFHPTCLQKCAAVRTSLLTAA